MNKNGYYRPESCQVGNEYFIREENNSTNEMYKLVVFVSYRPHPGELLIKEDGVTSVIYRRQLYARKKQLVP
ncbi:MAG: hypothetical protein MUO54_16170 [Anaerolineales bacterium]|nr:hypothetical protein [Anaerolineales bacterium]